MCDRYNLRPKAKQQLLVVDNVDIMKRKVEGRRLTVRMGACC